jgi:hypothetical protein
LSLEFVNESIRNRSRASVWGDVWIITEKGRDEYRSERRTWYNRLATVDVGKVTAAWQGIEGRD